MSKELFTTIYSENIKREGSAELFAYLGKSDFFTAPASSRFHLACNGGLCEHSVNVYSRLIEQDGAIYKDQPSDIPYSDETLAIVSLLHDLCKVNIYKPDFRNVKNDKGVWEKVPCYTIDEKFSYGGHGSKSVFIIQQFMKLTPQEACAINCHMGAYDRASGDYSIGQAFEQTPLALMLSVADQYATFIDEVEK